LQVEAERNAVLGPRQRRKVTYNEARLARAPDGAGLTPAKDGAGLTPAKERADEDFRPAATATGASSDSDTSGSEVAEGDAGAAGKRGRPPVRVQHARGMCTGASAWLERFDAHVSPPGDAKRGAQLRGPC